MSLRFTRCSIDSNAVVGFRGVGSKRRDSAVVVITV